MANIITAIWIIEAIIIGGWAFYVFVIDKDE